ncbi:type I-E CRISPR-associated protein Cas6/Cse3/CasE [Verticiella sediminum]|uniref:Type I-E CRISPR-associated protein Cas6/Cse3/CasE n=1 Tax=Verticiella sediminum TaxID=1247510 RepID=A0A556B1F9_9BURK|nr:type I-E CRISPR-associated protein Cas6/Cse3/CasE [Verticiella sediminum]TSH99003.1 type I-E CRISPR-associated protein Cas6/Cse3/CasE [Verticiella sediminum]
MTTHYFSRARLVGTMRTEPQLQRWARQGEAYRDHRLVWQLFASDPAERDFLFRSERLPGGELVYYVVSARAPQGAPGLFSVQTKPYTPVLRSGEWLRFDLRANPVVSRKSENGRAVRHDVLMDAKHRSDPQSRHEAMEAAGLNWLMTRAERWGLSIDPGTVIQSGYLQHRFERKGERLSFSSLDYQGLARVEDADALARTLLHGVGRAKGFGCGLLLVKRVS